MDAFTEKIVAKKKSKEDYTFFTLIIVASVLAAILLLTIPYVSYFAPFIDAGILFGAYYLIRSRNVEFEYSFTNDELDMDVIIAKKKRMKALSTSCKNFDIVARYNSGKYEEYSKGIAKKFTMVSSLDSPDVYFATLNYKSVRTLILFEPGSKMLDMMKVYIPKKVFED